MSNDLQLVSIEGAVEAGTACELSRTEPLMVGRSAKGLRVPDPLVSIQHAEIRWEAKRGYVVVDLDSAHGTWVDEECIRKASRPIGVGSRLRFGESVFEVRHRRASPKWMFGVLAAVVGAGGLAVGFVSLVGTQPAQAPLLQWTEPIHQGARSSEVLDVPEDFTRVHGLAVERLRIRRVSDFDYDGIDEVWLRNGTDAEYVVTFTADGAWKVLGELPAGCLDTMPGGGGIPVDGLPGLDCEGVDYLPLDDGYQRVGHDGVVAWVRGFAKASGATDGHHGDAHGAEPAPPSNQPVQPVRVVLREPQRLSGFLVERGIQEPVHYILCEDAFPGLRAQVLTASGQILPLAQPCLSSLTLDGTHDGHVVALATTAAGHDALLDDLTTFLSGEPDGLWLDGAGRAALAPFWQRPGVKRGGVKLKARSQPLFGEAIAREELEDEVRTPLAVSRTRTAPEATTQLIVEEGTQTYEGPGCHRFQVTTQPFACGAVCTGDFLRVDEVGCEGGGRVLTVGYDGGVVDGRVDDAEVRAVVEAGSSRVLRARVSWRSLD